MYSIYVYTSNLLICKKREQNGNEGMCLSHDRTLYLQRIYVCLLLNTISRLHINGLVNNMELNLLAAPILALCFMFSKPFSHMSFIYVSLTHTHTHTHTHFLAVLSVASIYVVSVSHSLSSLCALILFVFLSFSERTWVNNILAAVAHIVWCLSMYCRQY